MPACRCMGVQLRDLNARTHLRDATVRPLRSPAFVPLRLSVAFTIEMYYRLFTENLAACCSPSGAGSAAASVLSAVLCKHLILNQSSFNSADAGKGEGTNWFIACTRARSCLARALPSLYMYRRFKLGSTSLRHSINL